MQGGALEICQRLLFSLGAVPRNAQFRSQMKRKLIVVLLSGCGVFLVALVAGMILLKSLLTAEFLVTQLESNMNVRAEVKELNISLFSIVSSVELRGVKLAPRDRFADQAVPLKERPALTGAVISAGAFDLKLRLGALMDRRFELERLVLDEPEINLVLFASGQNNLSSLFGAPKTVAGKPNPAYGKKPATEEKTKPTEPKAAAKEQEAAKPFSVRDLPIAANLKALGIEKGKVNIRVERTGQLLRIAPLTLTVKDIDIDPADLAKHNQALVRFDMGLSVLGRDGKESSRFGLRSGGKVVPFDSKTGQVNTSVTYKLTVLQGTFIDGFALTNQLAGAFPLLQKAGVELKGVGGRAELSKDVALLVGYGGSRVTFLQSALFPTKNYDLNIDKGAWLQLNSNQHLLTGSLLASKEESARAIASADARLEKALAKTPDVKKEDLRKQLLGPITKGDRISLPFSSSGDIRSPTVRLAVQLPSLADLLKGQLGDLAKGKLNKLLKDDPRANELRKKLPKLPF